MSKTINGYKVRSQIDIGRIQNLINDKKETFKSTNWTDENLMIEAAAEIVGMEKAFKETLEIHKFILENLGGI